VRLVSVVAWRLILAKQEGRELPLLLMWFKHLCNLFGRSWNATTAGYGTTTLGFVLWTLLLTADWGVGKAIEFATGRAAGVVGSSKMIGR